jgi:hypothetical protein
MCAFPPNLERAREAGALVAVVTALLRHAKHAGVCENAAAALVRAPWGAWLRDAARSSGARLTPLARASFFIYHRGTCASALSWLLRR